MKPMRAYYEKLYRVETTKSNPAVIIYDRLRIDVIRQLIPYFPGKTLIAGCGSKNDVDLLPGHDEVFAFDLAVGAVRWFKKGSTNVFTGDVTEIPVKSNQFDTIICSEVLEHVPDIEKALSEFRRVIKPGGVLIVSSPNWISLFGFVRWIAEKVFRTPFTSHGQPYDDWKTYKKYQNELFPFFGINESRGVWYLPPLHFRNEGLSAQWMNKVFRLYSPLEGKLSRRFSKYGHLIVLKCLPLDK